MLLVGRDIEESNNTDTLSWRTVRWDIYMHDDKDMILEELLDDIKEDTERCVWSSIISTLLLLR